MRYYTVKAQINNDETEVRDMRGFDTLDEALARFHTDMTNGINKCKSIICLVIDDRGAWCKNDSWRKQEEPEE